jgi:branched-chain amino acid transport system substrate-binding protein
VTSTVRRDLLKAGAAAASLGFPAILRAQTSTLKVGVILPLSGPISFPGLASRRGMDLAVKMFAEQGQRIEVQAVDTESKPENGRIAAERLIRDGASILVGAWDSGTTISAAQAAEAAKVPLVVFVASAPQITEQGFTQVFRNFTPSTQLTRDAVNHVKNLEKTTGRDIKTAVIMHTNDTFGTAVNAAVTALWKQLDVPFQIVDTISYSLAARDLSVEVAKAKAAKPDILCPITRVNDAILIVREMVKQDFNPMGIIGPGSPGPYEKPFTDALGKYADDYITNVPWYDPTRPLTKRVLERWAKDHPNERFELNSGFGWEGIQVVADAWKRAGSNKPADLHSALKATNIADHVMFGGPIQFDAKGQNNNIGGAMLQNQGGQPVVVAPREIAQAALRFPATPWNRR